MDFKFLKTYSGATDIEDSRDFTSEELFWAPAPIKLPPSASVDIIPFLNQGAIGACTVFGSSWALFNTEAQDAIVWGYEYKQPYDPWAVWAKAKTLWASDKNWWVTQSALKLEKDLWYSKGYANVWAAYYPDLDRLKYWIFQWRAITTGSKYWDWWKILKTGIYSESSKYAGHCFQLTKYDDNKKIWNDTGWFYCPNSWGGRWAFWISYKMANKLFTQYIALGPTDMKALQDLKNIKTKEYLLKSKDIWNGKNGSMITSPYEIMVMVNRSQNWINTKTRREYAELFNDRILRWFGILNIWNEKDWEHIATEQEIAVMFTTSASRERFTDLKFTRLQTAAIIGRDLIW